ncbi:hypothetical protein SLEP1_g44132 [Rubroshorea leprosula]|uniref:Ferredoxin n=1 Tax=Rubroshorea leprosula TaxID=152421 RepID=A0AAV5LH08_9ROSI|nr:hypothetical protein SLEP1_g44132 [Rubroshorea leprosula]
MTLRDGGIQGYITLCNGLGKVCRCYQNLIPYSRTKLQIRKKYPTLLVPSHPKYSTLGGESLELAISTLDRLSSQIHGLPSLSPHIFTRSSATATATASKKVANRIVKRFANDQEWQKRQVVGLAGQTHLRALANGGLIDPASHRLEEIDACSAECEVNIAEEWLEKLPPRSYDKEYVLKRNSRARVLNKHSRLGCQVLLTPELQGMVVAVPEPKPWDIP